MPTRKTPIVEASLDLAWSHWTALGVRGIAQPPSTAVDPEALLYFTACLVDQDPRLRTEVADWWNRYERFVSRPRMNALGKRFGAVQLEGLVHSFARTPRTGKSVLDHLNTRARSLLRLRSAFGANARAEVLLELLTREGRDGLTALALSEVGYSKRNIAFVLEELVMAGLLVAASEGNRVRYRLADRLALERVLQPLPSTSGRWHLRLPVIAAFIKLALRLRDRDAVVQSIEARKTLEPLIPIISAAGIAVPAPSASAETYWPELQQWLIENVLAEASDTSHRLDGMIEGVWVSPNEAITRIEQPTGALLPRTTANTNDRELICLDLVQLPTVAPATDWVWAVLSTAATTTYAHTIGLNKHERWRFVTRQFGEERTYDVEYTDPLPHDRISRAYGKVAASRARADQPAVQLRLTRALTAVLFPEPVRRIG